MKNVLFATSALVAMSAGGVAFADAHEGGISLSGDARLGLIYVDNTVDSEVTGTSRARLTFKAEGTSDAGISFGFKIRADNAAGAADQAGFGDHAFDEVSTAGEVYVGGSFGTLTYGDTDSAVAKRVSHVDFISLTGLEEPHEIGRGAQAGPRIRYDYDFDSFGFSVSTQGDLEEFAVGAGGTFDFGSNSVSVGIGYDDLDSTIAASLGAGFGPVDFKVAYSTGDTENMDLAVSLGYSSGALSIAGFYRMQDDLDLDIYGVGMGYDLGGGLELKTGIARSSDDVMAADLGFAMTF